MGQLKKKIIHTASQIINGVLFFLLYFRMKNRKNPSQTDKVLIIRFAHIGDFIVWLDSAKEYKRLYPGKQIVFMCYNFKNVTPIAQKLTFFDEVVCVDTWGLQRLKELIRLSNQSFDTVINANPSRSILSDLFVMAPFSKERIAPQTDTTCIGKHEISRSNSIYTKVIPCGGVDTMELVRNAQFIRGLGAVDFLAQVPQLPIMAENPLAGMNYFAVCSGAETAFQRWPKEKFAALIDDILQKTELQCVLVGTKQEQPLGEIIRSLSRFSDRITVFMGKSTLLEYIEVIRGAQWLISNDTSAVHIAAATGVRSVVFGAGWNKGRFYPYVEESAEESKVLPVSITAEMDCLACGKTGAELERSKCIINGTAACISNVSLQRAEHAINEIIKQRRDFVENGR